MFMKILRRVLPALMVLALVIVPGIPGLVAHAGGAENDGRQTSDKANDLPSFAAFDTVKESVDEKGNKVVDYLKGDVLVRREVYVGDVIEVYILGADGTTLEHSGTIRPDDPPPVDLTYEKYTDDQGRTIVDTFEKGVLIGREVYDPATGVHVYTVYQDGEPVDSKTWTDAPEPTPFFDETNSYPDETGTAKIVDYLKGGVVVRREIYWSDRMEVYVLTPEGQLVLDESQSQTFPSPEPQPWDEETKYQDDKGNTIKDYLKEGVVIRREVYAPDGSFRIYELDKDGNLSPVGEGSSGSSPADGGTDPAVVVDAKPA